MKKPITLKPRNRLAALAKARRAGAHVKTEKARRRAEKIQTGKARLAPEGENN